MTDREINFELYRFRAIDRKIKRAEDQLSDAPGRISSLEESLATLVRDRVRHEMMIAEMSVLLERINRRLELVDDRTKDDA